MATKTKSKKPMSKGKAKGKAKSKKPVRKPVAKKIPIPEYLGVKYATGAKQREALTGLVTLILATLGFEPSAAVEFVGKYDRITPKYTKWRELWLLDAIFIRENPDDRYPAKIIDKQTPYGFAVLWAATMYMHHFFLKPVKVRDRDVDIAQESAERLKQALILPDALDCQRMAVRLLQLAHDHQDVSLRDALRASVDVPFGGSFREVLEDMRSRMSYAEVRALEALFTDNADIASLEEPVLPEVKPRIEGGLYVVDANSGAILCEDGGRIYPPNLDDGNKIVREASVWVGNTRVQRVETRVPQGSNYAEWAAFFKGREPKQATDREVVMTRDQISFFKYVREVHAKGLTATLADATAFAQEAEDGALIPYCVEDVKDEDDEAVFVDELTDLCTAHGGTTLLNDIFDNYRLETPAERQTRLSRREPSEADKTERHDE